MFSDLNPFDRETAILEIALMLIGAFLIGFILAWILKKRNRNQAPVAAQPPKAERSGNEQNAGREMQAKVKTLTAQKNEAEAQVDLLALEIKALKSQAETTQVPSAAAESGGEGPGQMAMAAQVKALEKTIRDNKAELARMDALRDQIKDLQDQLEEAESTASAGVVGGETKSQPSEELVRVKAELAIQEAAARRYESQNRQLKTAKESLTKERDQALERLDDLQFRMDKLQRQVESIRTNTREREQKSMQRSGQSSKGRDLNQLTSLKGLGYRSLEFLESLGINTMDRLSQTDANTIQHIAKKLDKPVEMVESWVKSAQDNVNNG